MLPDDSQRQQATNPNHSFIVQAPAGSGKTELLTQRYLRLLSSVDAPEQIIALTFTRKAANEMRARILLALTNANKGSIATSSHQQLTYRYANDALRQSQMFNWQLLDNPSRLRIITIDSLCQLLTHAIPLYERQTSYATITDDSKSLYQQAVRACVSTLLNEPRLHPIINTLLQHLDNRQDKLLDLLTGLLANRDQWLAPLFAAKHQSKEHYELALLVIEQHELARFIQHVPLSCQETLCRLSRQMAIVESDSQSLRYPLTTWNEFKQINRTIAVSLAALLLTTDGKLRKSFDHHVGLKTSACDKLTYRTLKADSQTLLKELAFDTEFLTALKRLKKLPPPCYDKKAWEVLQALLTLLPLSVAHLQLIFQETNEVDFSAVAEQALLALGDEDAPTDLALYLDYTIHHLLVDEFQDTSISQFQLLTKLVQGWLPNDGRTLFIVGDPMQSIYRFRQAEVGLFLKAQQKGIGPVSLTNLALTCNFRSTATLVNWVNQHFYTIFPNHNDIEMGAISFHPALSIMAHTNDSGIFAEQFNDAHSEALAIVNCISQEIQQYPNQTIALLVRSRHQLSAIVPLLRQNNISFQGVDVERLASLPYLQDMLTLIKSLLLPANRLSWLALLRSPWVGIKLSDLHKIANFDQKKSIYFALSNLDNLHDLSDDGKTRAQFIYSVMHHALITRHQQPLIDWLMTVMHHLYTDVIIEPAQQLAIEQFWTLLARFIKDGQLNNWSRFEAEFNQLYLECATPAQLQIMTIHKAKGLEFDCVILPSLSSRLPVIDKPLLRWLKLTRQCDADLLLLSPIRAIGQDNCPLYDYLGNLQQEKEQFERQRLLYVAVTRARKRLYFFDCHTKKITGSFRDLLHTQPFQDTKPLDTNAIKPTTNLDLLRLPLTFYKMPLPITPNIKAITCLTKLKISYAQQVGIITHQLLQWICDNHPETLAQLPWPMIKNRFKEIGFTILEQQQALTQLQRQISQMLDSSLGQWLCRKHQYEHNEYELLFEEQGEVVTKIIDRTFYDRGSCWVIDFKTGQDDITTQKAHRQQVNDYATLLATMHDDPIECGLYYLNTRRWVTWSHDKKISKLLTKVDET
jgi:ATP-dependent helicase/nuclease subunit A